MKRSSNNQRAKTIHVFFLVIFGWGIGFTPQSSYGETANYVWLVDSAAGGVRINIDYTIPELRQRRLAARTFVRRQAAVTFAQKLLRGASFYIKDGTPILYEQQPQKPRPW